MRGVKKWGIRIEEWWVADAKGKDATYTKRSDAVKEAASFNSMRPKGDDPYVVKEYK